MMGEDLDDRINVESGIDNREIDDDEWRSSGATIAFWVLVVFLICLGLCVLLSVVLAISYGS